MRKGGAVLLMLVLVLSCITIPVGAEENAFRDVCEGDYFYAPVLWAVNNGITSGIGDGQFGPSNACTRGQVVTFLWRAAGSPEPSAISHEFADVGVQDYYYKPVLWAVEKGITAGVGGGRFGPEQTCTRGQIVTFLWKFKNPPESDIVITKFIDVDSRAYYARAVAWAVDNGVTAGVSEYRFGPEQTCTRGQVMTFLYKTIQGGSDHPAPPTTPGATQIVYGTSGAGRKLMAYRYGKGKNVMIVTFGIHGWEDQFGRDGQLLVETAQKLCATLQAQGEALLLPGDWSVYVFPCLNPDGLFDGWTHNGPGRCTTHRIGENGALLRGGVDMNRCFPYRFSPNYTGRYYTGDKPLQAVEARALYECVKGLQGRDRNILIDVHGWYDQIICPTATNGQVYRALKKAFPSCDAASLAGGRGYFSAWAAFSQGFDACLFEFPDIANAQDFSAKKMDMRFIDAICEILRTYR